MHACVRDEKQEFRNGTSLFLKKGWQNQLRREFSLHLTDWQTISFSFISSSYRTVSFGFCFRVSMTKNKVNAEEKNGRPRHIGRRVSFPSRCQRFEYRFAFFHCFCSLSSSFGSE
mmetsp:Transcript_4290/g.9639  ORF Transcript_4290/g.9639 Transcript_4290/m.9639 type:complete len:115 (+) Transcript_4290:550-894(+)